MARHRQAPSLDRVSEDNARSIYLFVAGDESVGKRFEIMATEVFDQVGHLVVVHAGEELMHRLGGVFQEALSNLRGIKSEERLILLVRHFIDPQPQSIATGRREGASQFLAVLQFDDVPAGRLEVSGPLLEAHPRNHSV